MNVAFGESTAREAILYEYYNKNLQNIVKILNNTDLIQRQTFIQHCVNILAPMLLSPLDPIMSAHCIEIADYGETFF